jgi:hypothetical protein
MYHKRGIVTTTTPFGNAADCPLHVFFVSSSVLLQSIFFESSFGAASPQLVCRNIFSFFTNKVQVKSQLVLFLQQVFLYVREFLR